MCPTGVPVRGKIRKLQTGLQSGQLCRVAVPTTYGTILKILALLVPVDRSQGFLEHPIGERRGGVRFAGDDSHDAAVVDARGALFVLVLACRGGGGEDLGVSTEEDSGSHLEALILWDFRSHGLDDDITIGVALTLREDEGEGATGDELDVEKRAGGADLEHRI